MKSFWTPKNGSLDAWPESLAKGIFTFLCVGARACVYDLLFWSRQELDHSNSALNTWTSRFPHQMLRDTTWAPFRQLRAGAPSFYPTPLLLALAAEEGVGANGPGGRRLAGA